MNNNSFRKSNFELMRIFAIILILIHHYVLYGLGEMTIPCSKLYSVFTHFIGCFGKTSVCLFILITGYFMINTSKIKFKHILKILIDCLFYSWLLLIIFLYIFPNYINITPMKIYKSLLPVSTGQLWFIRSYLVLYLIIPLINKIFKSLSQRTIKIYLLLFAVLWYLIPTFTIKINYGFSQFVGFVYLYLLGAYINQYGIKFFHKTKNIIFTILFSLVTILGYITACVFLNVKNYEVWLHFSNESSIFTLLIALSVFYFFKNLDIQSNKIINYLAASVLSIYIITENVLLRDILFTKIFHCCDSCKLSYLISNILIMIIFVYLFTILLDLVKNKIIMDKINKIISNSKFVKYIDEKFFGKIE